MTKETTKRIVKLEAENAALRKIVTDFHWMARRYADGRSSYVARMFNEHTRAMIQMGWNSTLPQMRSSGRGMRWVAHMMD